MRRFTPAVEPLEGRRLPSTYTQSLAQRAAWVRHEEHVLDGKLQEIELESRATPQQELALRDDARAISAEAAATTLDRATASAKAVAASLILDNAPLEGWLGDAGWSAVRDRLGVALQGLVNDPALLDRTVANMRSLATSAGVTYDDFRSYSGARDRYQDSAMSLRNSGYHFPDPQVYYTQHLRGFFRGGATERASAKAKLESDLQSLAAQTQDTPQAAAVLHRDVASLERLAAGTTSQAAAQLLDAYAATFDQGPPSAESLAEFRSQATSIVGTSPASARDLDRLIADAPVFFAASGASPANIRAIVADVRVFVETGGASSLNPFLVRAGAS
jgi:hypothetical protein